MPRRIVKDVEATKALPNIAVCTLNDDETVSLSFDNGQSFIITITDDYPAGSSFWFCEQTKEADGIEGSLPDKIYPALFKIAGCKKPDAKSVGFAAAVTTTTIETGHPIAKIDSNNNDGMGSQQESSNGNESSGGGGMGSQQTSSAMMHAGYSDDMMNEDDALGALSPVLLKDIELADKKFGYRCRHERIAIGVRITVEFYLTDLVSESTAMAWGFSRNSPFSMRIQFERPEYTRSEKPPEILITQDGAICRFGQQVKNFVNLYIHDHWSRSGWAPPAPPDYSGFIAGASGAKGTTGAQNFEKLLNLLTPPQRLIYDQLCRMGFKEAIAAPAARQSATVEEAVDKCTNGTVLAESTSLPDSRSWFDNLKQKAFGGGNNEEEEVNKKTNNPISLTSHEGKEISPDGIDPKKFVPFIPEEEGWLVHIVKYIRKRTPLAHTFCVICDNPHLIGAGMLKPCVCERELCTFGFQQLKVGADSASSVATGGGVIDLLVTMFRCAVESSRRELIVDPYPQIADPKTGKLVFDPKHKDFTKLTALTNQLPNSREILGVENLDQLSSKLVGKDPLLLPLLEWIISSNRSLIVKLRTDQLLKKMHTPHQFLLVSASPEKQARFDALKERHGSIYMFHGSPLHNLHSILRNGLRNYSGKSGYQLCGAVLGAGVYTASDISTSLSYSRAQGITGLQTKDSANREGGGYIDGGKEGQIACMILVEIAKDPNGYKDHGNVKTVQNEDAIITRFFFIFTSNDQVTKSSSLNTTNPEFEKDLRTLVAATS